MKTASRAVKKTPKSFQDLPFGEIDVLKRIKEKVVQCLFGSHDVSPMSGVDAAA